MLIKAMNGKEVVPGRETHVYCFFVPSQQFPGTTTHLGLKAKEPYPDKPIRLSGQALMVPARNGMKTQIVGQWFTQDFDVEPGVLIKVIARINQGGLSTSGGVLLQARPDASLVRVQIPLSGFQNTPYSLAFIEGRFDVLNAGQAAQEGAELTELDRRAFLPANRARAMNIHGIAPEITSRTEVRKEVVTSSSGEEVEAGTARRRRRIEI